MRIKTKLTLGVGFLFGVSLLIGGLSAVYLNLLSGDAEEILKNNYESIEYAQNMTQALDDADMDRFEKNLSEQEANITETGEKELTFNVRHEFNRLRQHPSDTANLKSIRIGLNSIVKINMLALVRKNKIAQETSHNALVFIGIIGSICFIVTFTFIVNFPGYIANPIRELTEGIREISNKNYDERLTFKSQDEFGELAEAFNSMAQKLDVYENSNLAQILFEKKRIETIINKMNDPIIGLDEKKKILFVNSEAARIIGKTNDELVGSYAPDVAVENDLLRSLIKEVMDNSIFKEAPPILKIFADGKESYFTKEIIKITSTPTGEKKMISVGFVIILKNITAFKELDLAKTNFMAIVSHELKTPLASIQMCTQLLEDNRIGDLNDEQSRIIKTVQGETERLVKITGELLNLAQVETGNLQLRFQLVRPIQIIEAAFNALKFQAELKQMKVTVHCADNLPNVNADLEKTTWVMVNFLTNAIHHSLDASTIILSARQQKDKIVFAVQDFGEGIESFHVEHIFEKFYKVPGRESSHTGTGLGLTISKDFINAENGRIWAVSDPGKGSTFSFELPVVS